MLDRFETWAPGLDGPATHAFAITPNDTADLAEITRALYVGGTGDVSVVLKSGDTAVFAAVAASVLLPIQATRVNATGTTATNILGLS